MHQTYATKDVAEQIGVSETTIKTWTDKLGLEVERDSRHNRRYTQAELDLLFTVKNLRDEGAGYQTITRVVGRAPDERQTEPDEQLTGDSRPQDAQQTMDATALAEQIRAAVVAAVRSDTELAEKYARAAHRIGELEADVRHLQEKADKLLTDGTAEADRLRQEVESLRADLATEKAKPWWRKLLGS
jgi:DNA-binding transcriptional MerR regulator